MKTYFTNRLIRPAVLAHGRWWILFFLTWTSLSLITTLKADQFGDFTYETNASAVTITAYTGLGGNVIIPTTIVGLPVTYIGSGAFANRPLTSISLPNSVTSIGEEAFYGCTGLTSIALPNSVTSLGIFAFSECSALTNITIPSSVTNIGGAAFIGCTALPSINVDALNPTYSSADGVRGRARAGAWSGRPGHGTARAGGGR